MQNADKAFERVVLSDRQYMIFPVEQQDIDRFSVGLEITYERQCRIIFDSKAGKVIKRPSVVQQTIDFLTDAMMKQQLKPGDKIPTETELAETLGIARNSVREAIKMLVFLIRSLSFF